MADGADVADGPGHGRHVGLAVRSALRGVHRLNPAARAMVVAFGDAVAHYVQAQDDHLQDAVQGMLVTMLRTQVRAPLVLDRRVRLVTLARLGTVALCEALRVSSVADGVVRAVAKCLWGSVQLVVPCGASTAPPRLHMAALEQLQACMEACVDCWYGEGVGDRALHACVALHSVVAHCLHELPVAPEDRRPSMALSGLCQVVRTVYSAVPLHEVLRVYADEVWVAATWAALGPAVGPPPTDVRRHLCGLMVQLRP